MRLGRIRAGPQQQIDHRCAADSARLQHRRDAEVVGRIDAEAGDQAKAAPGTVTSTTDKVLGRDKVDLAEFEVSSIKEVAGTCPTTPAAR